MRLLGHASHRCAPDNPAEHNFLRRSRNSFALILALFSWFSLAGCVGVAGNNTALPSGKGQLSASPNSVAFGNVNVGGSSTQTVTLSNSGSTSLTLSQAGVTGPGFTISGLTFPLTLVAGQSYTLNVRFGPTVGGSVSGSVSLVSDGSYSPTVIAVTGTGVTSSPQLSVSPTNVSFGNVLVGSTATQTVTLTNTGNSSLSISQVNVSGAGFGTSGLTPPLTLTAGQSATFSVIFGPATSGGLTGSVTVLSNATNSPTTIALSGTGVQPQLSVTPNSASFGNVVVGTTNTQTIILVNSGTANLTISQATVSGSGFTTSGLTLPVNLSPGQSTTFNIAFSPASTGNFTASVSLVSNAPTSPTAIALSGAGISATLLLTATPTSLSFGNVAVGSSSTQTVTLTNTGNSSVSISLITVSGAGFSTSGLALPLTLTNGQTATLNVVFAPTTAGGASGSIAVVSNATNSPATITLSGSAHSVALSWTASTSVVVGYYVYRGAQTGGPYAKLNSTPVAVTTYTDSNVQSGQTYFYAVTAVDSNNVESVYSNEISAIIP